MKRTLFLTWQDPIERRWYPVGRLVGDHGKFLFSYTKGAIEARQTGRFEAVLTTFPDLHTVYEASKLFPLFSNRVLSPSRPEYQSMLKWLNVEAGTDDPLAILAKTGGRRETDTYGVFPFPEPQPNGRYTISFLVHGVGHMSQDALKRTERLSVGERLLLMKDFQNPYDPLALALRTAETAPGDMFLVGYCPRYLRSDIIELMEQDHKNSPLVSVEKVNLPPVPAQFRLLCRLDMKWPVGFRPFSQPEYQPIVGEASNTFAESDPLHVH